MLVCDRKTMLVVVAFSCLWLLVMAVRRAYWEGMEAVEKAERAPIDPVRVVSDTEEDYERRVERLAEELKKEREEKEEEKEGEKANRTNVLVMSMAR